MMRFLILPFLISALFSCSATRKSLSPEEYVAWYKSDEYPYRDTIAQNDVLFILEGIPDVLDLSRQYQAKKITTEEMKTALEENKGAGFTYNLTIVLPQSGVDIYSYAPQNTPQDFDRHHYFSFGMKEDVFALRDQNDTIACGFFLQERLISNFPRARFSFDFGNDPPKQIIYNDRIFTGKPVIFNLNQQPSPGLKTKSIK